MHMLEEGGGSLLGSVSPDICLSFSRDSESMTRGRAASAHSGNITTGSSYQESEQIVP
jgi:hypothetical protein